MKKFNLGKMEEILKNNKITKGLKRGACYATMATMILTSTGCSNKDKETYTNEELIISINKDGKEEVTTPSGYTNEISNVDISKPIYAYSYDKNLPVVDNNGYLETQIIKSYFLSNEKFNDYKYEGEYTINNDDKIILVIKCDGQLKQTYSISINEYNKKYKEEIPNDIIIYGIIDIYCQRYIFDDMTITLAQKELEKQKDITFVQCK